MKAVWCDRPIIDTPFAFCLCVTDEQYHGALKHLKIPEDMWGEFLREGSRATVHRYTNSESEPVALVCIRPTQTKTLLQMHAVLAHEAVHLWQWMKRLIGEDEPSDEFEAYAIQAISQRLFYAYDDLTKKRKKKK